MKAPDQVRFSEIMGDLDRAKLMELRVIEFGGDLSVIEDFNDS